MENYRKVKDIVYKRNIFNFDQLSLISYCDFAIQIRYIPELNYKDQCKQIECLEQIQENNNVFIDFWQTEYLTKILLEILHSKKIRVNFFHFDEPYPKKEFLEMLLPYTNHIYTMNNIYDHPQIHNLPLGVKPNAILNLIQEKKHKREKEILCFMEFSFTHGERKRCYDILGNKSFITNIKGRYTGEKKEPMWECLFCNEVIHPAEKECPVYEASHELLQEFVSNQWTKRPLESNNLSTPNKVVQAYRHKSYYALHPSGAGEACHSFWEELYLDCIPIVKRTNTYYDRVYEFFPCLIVNDWTDVTKELLEASKDELQEKINDFNKSYPTFYTDINTVINIFKNNT
jgi:hypothetical protein